MVSLESNRKPKTQNMEAWMGRFEKSKVGDVIIVSKIKENEKKNGVAGGEERV